MNMWLEVDPSNRRGWNGIGYSGERRLGPIIENVEAADTEMVVVVGKEFWEIQMLVFHCIKPSAQYSTKLTRWAYGRSPAMHIAIYSSSSAGGRGGNGSAEEMSIDGVVKLSDWSSEAGGLSVIPVVVLIPWCACSWTSGGPSGTSIGGLVTLCGWASRSGDSSAIIIGGLKTLCCWASVSGDSLDIFVWGVVRPCGRASLPDCCSPVKADAVDSADCFAFLSDRDLYVWRNLHWLLGLDHIKATRRQTTTTATTRFVRYCFAAKAMVANVDSYMKNRNHRQVL